mmetsp:Transcript_30618/g.64152  ORF Transcript_30618/g.64152 Transcript_30618/m.64152 type:complete len:96 (+) Transcript_30618:2312-2599(+)
MDLRIVEKQRPTNGMGLDTPVYPRPTQVVVGVAIACIAISSDGIRYYEWNVQSENVVCQIGPPRVFFQDRTRCHLRKESRAKVGFCAITVPEGFF